VYGIASLILILLALVLGKPFTGYSTEDFLIFLALAIGPSCFGHTSYNYALKHLKAHGVLIAILGEPVGATLPAWIALKEPPNIQVILGGSLVIIGSILALREE